MRLGVSGLCGREDFGAPFGGGAEDPGGGVRLGSIQQILCLHRGTLAIKPMHFRDYAAVRLREADEDVSHSLLEGV